MYFRGNNFFPNFSHVFFFQGVAGTLPVETPFLDFLSKKGIRFTHNCVTTRYEFITYLPLLCARDSSVLSFRFSCCFIAFVGSAELLCTLECTTAVTKLQGPEILNGMMDGQTLIRPCSGTKATTSHTLESGTAPVLKRSKTPTITEKFIMESTGFPVSAIEQASFLPPCPSTANFVEPIPHTNLL